VRQRGLFQTPGLKVALGCCQLQRRSSNPGGSSVDIAGLVKGAKPGGGLGNKFLATNPEVDAIVHVVALLPR